MDIAPEILKQLIETFQIEFEEQLQVITDGLLVLEKNPDTPNKTELLNAIFRAAHNIKGSARGIGITSIGMIAHRLEDLFSSLRQNNLAPNSKEVDIGLTAIDDMRAAMQLFLHGEPANPTEQEKIAESTSNRDQNQETKSKLVIIPAKKAEISMPSKTAIPLSANEFVRVPLERVDKITNIGNELQSIRLELQDLAIITAPKLDHFLNVIHQVFDRQTKLLRQPSADPSVLLENIRDQTEAICLSLHELTIKTLQNLSHHNSQLKIILDSLRNNIQQMRLVPATTILRPLLRTARDLSHEFQKQIEVKIIGDEIEMDRVILALLKDPLVHLIRNAIDHAIEEPAERMRLGKPTIGQITIKITSESGKVLLSVADDGRGIDIEGIKQIAIQKKIVTAEKIPHLSKNDILDLIFLPGFSTKKTVSTISGRGVGMDVVRTNISQAKGNISIATETGKGTTITLKLPLTLISDNGLLVETCGQTFILPTHAIAKAIQVSPSEIKTIESEPTVLLNGTPILLRDLGQTLNLSRTKPETSQFHSIAIVTTIGRPLVGFIVDNFVSEREIIIKQLLPPLDQTPIISGATLTGRGEVVLILNPNRLIDIATAMNFTPKITDHKFDQEEVPKILVVDDSLTTRSLLVNILSAHNFNAKSVMDGQEAWNLLQAEKFDLVVTDIIMPIMNGFELTKKIKQHPTLKGLPVIIVSTLADDADKRQGVEAGADAYIVKSQFEGKDLVETVKQLLVL